MREIAIVLRENVVSNFKDFKILKNMFQTCVFLKKLNVNKPPSLGKNYCGLSPPKGLELCIVSVSHDNPGTANAVTHTHRHLYPNRIFCKTENMSSYASFRKIRVDN